MFETKCFLSNKKKDLYLAFNCVVRRKFGAHEREIYGGSERQFLMGKKGDEGIFC
jgi:hypothetical protein